MKRIVLLAVLSIAAGTAAAQECRIEYQRADNAMAGPGRPDGPLGTETLTLKPGETKVFNTDWKFEKRRNDGSNYYGSHVRILRNTGSLPARLSLKGNDKITGGLAMQVAGQKAIGEIKPGQSATQLRHDLEEVTCPGNKEARAGGGTTPGGTANPAQPPITPPIGLVARQASPDTIVLNWQPGPNVREYRVYVDPPPQPHLAGKPAVVGGNGNQFVIPLRNVAPGTVYHASIEAIGKDGSTSPRVGFPAVQVQLAGGPATTGGGNTVPATSSTTGSGQQCPPGQFVTGISSAGKIICAPR
jgi:hypothetical protein